MQIFTYLCLFWRRWSTPTDRILNLAPTKKMNLSISVFDFFWCLLKRLLTRLHTPHFYLGPSHLTKTKLEDYLLLLLIIFCFGDCCKQKHTTNRKRMIIIVPKLNKVIIITLQQKKNISIYFVYILF